jgi:hypothetical protein
MVSTFSSCAVFLLGSVGMPILAASVLFMPAFLSSSGLKPLPFRCFPFGLRIFGFMWCIFYCAPFAPLCLLGLNFSAPLPFLVRLLTFLPALVRLRKARPLCCF